MAMISRRQLYHSHTSTGSLLNASGVARSSALKRRQRPSSPRKVGTPLSAEIPAPVRTAIEDAFDMRDRILAVFSNYGMVPPCPRNGNKTAATLTTTFKTWDGAPAASLGAWPSSGYSTATCPACMYTGVILPFGAVQKQISLSASYASVTVISSAGAQPMTSSPEATYCTSIYFL